MCGDLGGGGFQERLGLLEVEVILPHPALVGGHQAANLALAVAMLRHQDAVAVDAAAMTAGARAVEWPARLQRLSSGPLVDLLPPGASLWLDGGHNVAGGLAIAAALAELEERAPRPLVLVGDHAMLSARAPVPCAP